MGNRAQGRKDLEHGVRLFLLEEDMDENDKALLGVREDLASIKKILVGVLVSVTTASILLVVNVLILGSR